MASADELTVTFADGRTATAPVPLFLMAMIQMMSPPQVAALLARVEVLRSTRIVLPVPRRDVVMQCEAGHFGMKPGT